MNTRASRYEVSMRHAHPIFFPGFFASPRARANDARVLLVGNWRSSRVIALAHALRACDLQ
jgi:hypothetical protein